MSPTLRLLTADDPALDAVARLMEDMQRHYQVPCPPRATILSGLRNRPRNAEIMVAAEDDQVVAFCAFNEIYPGPGLEAGIFLKELYVAQSRRGGGLGRSLMRELAVIARQRQLTRIDWTADADDQRLLAFYDQLGGMRKPEKLFYRLDGEGLLALSNDIA
jgi:ribosomal protein S18 acetylase RimI-like enzyme